MHKIKNDIKQNVCGGKIKFLNSKLVNAGFGIAVIGNTINSIFDIINTSNYLKNNTNYNHNPYQISNTNIRFGSDMRHSGIMGF